MTTKSSVRRREQIINLAYIALGPLIVIAILAISWLGVEVSVSAGITGMITGAIISLIGVRGLLLSGQPRGDERTRRLGAYASSWSWLAAVCVVSSLFLGEYYGVFHISTTQALGLTLASMLATIVLFNAYYRVRGDVE